MNTTTCSICTQKYRNLLVRKRIKYQMNNRYGVLIFILSSELLIGAIVIYLYTEMYKYTAKDTIFLLALSMVSLCFLLISYLLYCVIKILLHDVPPLWICQTKILEAHFLQR